jgi:CarD family transcriptional regulator
MLKYQQLNVLFALGDVSPVSASSTFLFWKERIEVFSVGDKVIYGSNLLCNVSGIQDKEFNHKTRRYYVIKPIFEKNSTIYFPIDSDVIAERIHRILTAEEIYAVLRANQEEEKHWIENDREREEQYRQILVKDDRIAILMLMKTLCLRKALGKKFNVSDERILKDSQKILCEELIYVLNIKREQLLPFILEQAKTSTKSLEGLNESCINRATM